MESTPAAAAVAATPRGPAELEPLAQAREGVSIMVECERSGTDPYPRAWPTAGQAFLEREAPGRSRPRGRPDRLCVDLRALPPADLSLLPLDPARSRRRQGCPAEHDVERAQLVARREARRGPEGVAVSRRSQPLDLDHPRPSPPLRRRASGHGCRSEPAEPRRGPRTTARPDRRPGSSARATAGLADDARTQWSQLRRDRRGDADVAGRRPAGRVRGATRAQKREGRSCDGV